MSDPSVRSDGATRQIAGFLAGIASTAPSPGSGAAGAVALALGIACARKAILISATREPADRVLAMADARLAAIGATALAGADEDAREFAGLIAAMRRQHATIREGEERAGLIRRHAWALVELSERLIGLAGDATAALAEAEARITATLANDVGAARALIEAARAIQAANVAENRRHLT